MPGIRAALLHSRLCAAGHLAQPWYLTSDRSQQAPNQVHCPFAICCQCLQVSQPGRQPSDAYDGYEASLSERHSDATSDTTQPEHPPHTHRPDGRPLPLSPSIRSSAASTEDILSPTLTHQLANGFTLRGDHAVSHQTDVPHHITNGFTANSHRAVSHQPNVPYHITDGFTANGHHAFSYQPNVPHHLADGLAAVSHQAVSRQPDVPTDVRSLFRGSTVTDLPAGQQSNLQSSYTSSAAPGLAKGGPGLRAQWGLLGGHLQAGIGHIGQSLTGRAFACEPHPRALSPELGGRPSMLPIIIHHLVSKLQPLSPVAIDHMQSHATMLPPCMHVMSDLLQNKELVRKQTCCLPQGWRTHC